MKPISLKLDLSNVRVDFTDERLGLPSASGANILAHCPGSWRMQMGRPDIGRFRDDADRGTKLHKVLAGDDTILLEHDEREDVRQMEDNCLMLVNSWAADEADAGEVSLCNVEERLYLRVNTTPVTSGQYDRLYLQGTEDPVRALLVDFKSGWQELGTTQSNAQLMVYALLSANKFPTLKEISVAIVRPRPGKPFWFTYRETQLESARQLWERVLREAFGESPALVAGGHCTFCKAQNICPARRAQLATFRVDAEVLAAKWETLDPMQKTDLYIASKSVAEFCEIIKQHVKEDMADERRPLPGLHWKPGAVQKTITITDADAALSRMLALGLTREDFLPAVTVSFAKLRDRMAEKLSWKKKDADDIAKHVFDGVFATSQNAPSIKIS